MEDARVAADDARQAAQQAAVKSNVDRNVNAEITGRAAESSRDTEARIDDVAGKIRDTAIDETARGARTLRNARSAARASQFVDYGFYVLYTLLVVRLGLALIAAQSTNGFVQFIAAVTAPFYAPFRGIVPSPSAEGFTLVLPIVIAIVVYAIVHAGINGLLRMVGSRKTAV